MKAKSLCYFHFIDEPKYRTQDSRAHVAHLLRAYRAHPNRYRLVRHCDGVYTVRTAGSSAVAMIETKGV